MVEEDESPNKDISKINVNQPAHVDKFTKKKHQPTRLSPTQSRAKGWCTNDPAALFLVVSGCCFFVFFCGVVWEDSAV